MDYAERLFILEDKYEKEALYMQSYDMDLFSKQH